MGAHSEPASPAKIRGRLVAAAIGLVVGTLFAIGGIAIATADSPGTDCTGTAPDDNGVVNLVCHIPMPTASTVTVTTPVPVPTTVTSTTTVTVPGPTVTVTRTVTATPTPTPTTTAGRLTNCFTQLEACGYPSRATTGIPAGVTLTTYTGPTTITAAGTVIDGKNLPCLTIKAANVVIRNSKITGPCFWGVSADSGSVRVERSVIDCTNYKGTGIGGGGFTVIASQLIRCENGADVAGGNNTVQDSYIGDVREVGGGHGDGIQAYTAGAMLRDVTVRHNTFDLSNPITSSLIMGYPADNLVVEDNFFAAGAFTVYCPNNPPITNVAYRNNRFYGPIGNWQADPHRPSFGYTDGCNKPGVIVWSGNYADNNLVAVNP